MIALLSTLVLILAVMSGTFASMWWSAERDLQRVLGERMRTDFDLGEFVVADDERAYADTETQPTDTHTGGE